MPSRQSGANARPGRAWHVRVRVRGMGSLNDHQSLCFICNLYRTVQLAANTDGCGVSKITHMTALVKCATSIVMIRSPALIITKLPH